ncbi:type II secretion system F family protein [Dermacoccaceae bacterium W4C1]
MVLLLALAPVLAGLCAFAALLTWPRPDPTASPSPDPDAVSETVRAEGVGAGEADPDVGDVAAAMELVALALSGGSPVVAALDTVAEEVHPILAADLRQVSAALRWGVDSAVAWGAVRPVWSEAGSALTLAERAGAAPAALVQQAAGRLRTQEAHRLEVAGAKLAVRIVLPLGLCFLPAFVLITIVPVVAALASGILQP